MTTSRLFCAASLLALLGSHHASGAAYVGSAYEGFDYTAGNMGNTLAGGTGWNATGDTQANTTTWGVGTSLTPGGTAANQAITAAGLDYTSAAYGAETGKAALITGSGQIGRSLGQTVDSGTFYFSYLTQKTVDQVRTVNLAFFGTNERIAIGQIASNVNTRDQDGNWLAGAGANTGNLAVLISNSQNNTAAQTTASQAANGVYVNTTSPVSYALNTTLLVVGKFEFNFNGGVEDRFTLYVNPGNLTDDSALTPYLVIDHNDFGSLSALRLFAGATSGGFTASAAQFDEIRLGSNYVAVTGAIPEPSSFAAIAGLAGLAFAATRRRRA